MTEEKSGEFRGKTVEAAINAGLAAFKLTREEVKIEIIRPGSRGVLGIGAEDAVVRLTAVQPVRAEPKPAPRPEPHRAAEPSAPSPAPAPKPELKRPAPVQPQPAQPQPAAAPKTTPAADEKAMLAAQKGKELLENILERMNVRAKVEIVPQSAAETDEAQPGLVLNIVGDELGILIGRHNETLSALEFITRLMVNQQIRTRATFTVDVNGYRAKRAESLRRLALRMAEQAEQTGRPVALEPMPPAERRIIHLALRDHPTMMTQSVGEGDRRKVTIIPRKG
ncbi:MAG: RNA-binding cell elongation regulator Jag/EloR [Anaerolineae bacterium]